MWRVSVILFEIGDVGDEFKSKLYVLHHIYATIVAYAVNG